MTHLDLFSGIGGFALAAKWAGYRTVAFCEIEPFCQGVLRKHWPDVWIHDDIRTLTGQLIRERVGYVDILTGGFPCQPHSVAGKRQGAADERNLWPEMLRLIRSVGPRWVVAENVPGIRNTYIDTVLSDLEEAGYSAITLVVGADNLGAPHRRKRAWIVAHSRSGAGAAGGERIRWPEGADLGGGSARAGLADSDGNELTQPQGVLTNQRGRVEHASKCVADSNGAGRGEQRQSVSGGEELASSQCQSVGQANTEDPDRRGANRTDNERRRDSETGGCDLSEHRAEHRLTQPCLGSATHGLPGWLARWPSRPGETQHEWEAPRVAVKVPQRTPKLKALGNAVVPQAAYLILQGIAKQVAPERLANT